MADRPRRRAQTWLFTLVFAALGIGTVAGFVIARAEAERTADRRVEQAAERAAALLEIELREVLSELGGAGVVVDPEGELHLEVFDGWASDLLESSEVPGLVLIDVATEAGEQPILAVAPESAGRSVIGLDFAAVPARRAVLREVAQTREAAASGVFELVTTGEPGIALVRPLLDRADGVGEVRGFVAAGMTIERLDATLADAVGDGIEATLVEGEAIVAGVELDPRDEFVRVAVAVPGRDWTVAVRGTAGPSLTGAWLVVVAGFAAITAMTALAATTERNQRRLAKANQLLVRNEERSRAVQRVTGRLARALTSVEVAKALVDHLPAAVGARSASIATMDPSGNLEVLGSDRSDGEPMRLPPLEGEDSTVEAALTHRTVSWLSSPLAWRNDPTTTALADDGNALAVLPLVAEDVSGVLVVSYPQVHIFNDDEQALLRTVSVLAARALARGRRYDAEHRAAIAFQRAALPDALPEVERLTTAARYRPAAHQATVGGDWYDVLVLDEHRVLLVVGDVVGHGMVAAAAMGRLRTAFRVIATLGTDPGSMLQAMSHQVAAIPNSFCTTVVCVVLDLEAGEMSWCRAGHPPPLLLGRHGTDLLDDVGTPPLGVVPETEVPVHTRQLEAGDLVVLYTDGLVERRTEDIDQSLRRLSVVAGTLVDLEPDELIDAMVEAMVPADEQSDDLAVLVVRYDGGASR